MKFLIFLLLFSLTSEAKKIEFPEEELAPESVLPVFDQPKAVAQRNVVMTEAVELGLFAGAVMNEPFFGPFNYGLYMTYHFNEEDGLNLMFNNWTDGETTFKKQLEADNLVNLDGAPSLDYMLLASYEYTAWYGKISITKQTVSNLHLYLLAGAGIVSIGKQINPAAGIGLGQKFYFTPSFAIRFDLRALLYNGPDPLSVTIPDGGPVPETSEFEKRLFTNSLITVGFVYLL